MQSLRSMMLVIAVAILVYMTAWFVLAVVLKRRDVVDSAWGPGFSVIGLAAFAGRTNHTGWALLALCLVSLWGLRLFAHIAGRNWNKPEDRRYAAMGTLGSWRQWLRSYIMIFLLQGLLMIIVSLPVIAIMRASGAPAGGVAALAGALWLGGIVFEAVADYQLRRFVRSRPSGSKAVMDRGLWRYSRHPNYFGEVTAWWGAALLALSFGQWWGVVGALVITVLITRVSGVPVLEKHYKDDEAYQAYAARTSTLLPLPPKAGL